MTDMSSLQARAEQLASEAEQVVRNCAYQDTHEYGCRHNGEPLLGRCEVCGEPERCRHCLEREAFAVIIRDLLSALTAQAEPTIQRYRMDIEFVHHAMSGTGGEATVVACPDPHGDWMKAP